MLTPSQSKRAIDELGGCVRVAEAFGRTRQCVHSWAREGMPEIHFAAMYLCNPGNKTLEKIAESSLGVRYLIGSLQSLKKEGGDDGA